MNCLAFDAQIAGLVDQVRAAKLRKMRLGYFPFRTKRKPRFCVTTTIQLCPRQRESKKYSESNC